jgi:ubiquinone/menaquinone biosynthesis C-methylase UbiE
MEKKRIKEVKEYFKKKAKYYDDVDEQSYWVFSDTLLWVLLKKLVLPHINKNSKILDAGGGTARWSVKIVEEIGCKATVYDISKDMLQIAQEKIETLGLKNNFNVIEGDIEDMSTIGDNTYDLTICFHNVLGFVDSPERAIKEMVRVTKKGGVIAIIPPNKYHSFYFNIYRGEFKQLDMNLIENKVQFTDTVPKMHTFTPDGLKNLFKKNGINPIKVLGFPVSVYPGIEETKLHGETQMLKNIFADKTIFEKLLGIEQELCMNEDAAGRGNMLLAIGKKL